ncbi:hypothetical protein HDV05_001087 [Chytridiales sp. JEL 0842]|nr:hypothetical protein HDV05_001087 [Chytridiales sp. JEL 0842]
MTTSLIVDPVAIKATAIATFTLLVKCVVTSTLQGGKRFAAGTRPPEDSKLGLNKILGKGKQQSYGLNEATDDEKIKKAKMLDIRWQRMVLNDLENIPIGLLAAWAASLTAKYPKLHAVLVLAFAGLRIGHTISYANELQPHRAIFWFGAVVAAFGMAANGFVGALTM